MPHIQAVGALDRANSPVFARAESSLASLESGVPVFTTMVFGHMAQYLVPFSNRVRTLGIPNVVVFVLDDLAERACEAARQTARTNPIFCLRGEGKTALQKYIVVIAYMFLGRDVFWFDFDSVWLKNPLPVLRAAQAAGEAEAASASRPAPTIYPAIDFDSKNCVMNAFFLIKATTSTLTWLLSLLHWIYKRPYAHDQLAFAQLLGIGPLVDNEPLPAPPPWFPLDPNLFGNAARFAGLGFSSEPEDLVFFHFFDGWNSNQPEATEQFATPVYRGDNMFEVLYGSDAEAARRIIAKSRLPAPAELKDCSYMEDNGLGVEIVDSGPVELPMF